MDNQTPADHPPCQLACPILTDAREYIQLIAERRFEEAFASIRMLNPLPGVCGRICTHPCETACKRGQVDEPLAIAALKRFASDGPWTAEHKGASPEKSSGEKVAIVGSGPAGLAAAHDLALLGHEVTIFEALPILGGMLRVGVPEYRLPKELLEKEIQAILSLGMEVKTGVRIGEDVKLAHLFDQGYKAIFVAVGAHEDRKLGIPGEDGIEGIVSAVSFLKEVNQGQDPKVGTRVAVVGGGNTAVDSARSALRLGAKEVHMVYRRSQEEMPAAKEEIEEAVHEGVQMAYLTSPVEILEQGGKVSALTCIRNDLGEPDASGRRSPSPVQGSEFTLHVDTVIAAVGQTPETTFLSSESGLAEGGSRIVTKDPEALSTPLANVFAGGDAVTGPATAIRAIAAGKRAALSIDRHLKEESMPAAETAEVVASKRLSPYLMEKTRKVSRCGTISLPMGQRLQGFEEVNGVLPEDGAVKEALRCLHCHLGARVDQERCVSCLTCVRVCPLGIPECSKMGEITIDSFACQACGVCVLECPVRAIDISLHPRSEIANKTQEAMGRPQDSEPVILSFLDLHGNFDAGDVKTLAQDYPNVLPVMVFGLRRVDATHVLKALETGADGVLLAMCPHDNDPFPGIREAIKERVARTAGIVTALGLDGARVQLCEMPERGLVDKPFFTDFLQRIRNVGPNPLRGS